MPPILDLGQVILEEKKNLFSLLCLGSNYTIYSAIAAIRANLIKTQISSPFVWVSGRKKGDEHAIKSKKADLGERYIFNCIYLDMVIDITWWYYCSLNINAFFIQRNYIVLGCKLRFILVWLDQVIFMSMTFIWHKVPCISVTWHQLNNWHACAFLEIIRKSLFPNIRDTLY